MRFLFIFLNSHQLKHHGRASSSWFFIFLLQLKMTQDRRERKKRRELTTSDASYWYRYI
ncbi:hypothetical protein V6Z11_D02G193500 [Gossypium hirsutum]